MYPGKASSSVFIGGVVGGGAMTYCMLTQLRSVSSIIRGNMAHTLAGERLPQTS